MDKVINWLEPWDSLCIDPTYFEKELYNEVGENHILYGKKVIAIGRRYNCDDVLFQVYDSEFSFAVVHLTYSGIKEENSNYPRTRVYTDFEDWVNRCMIPDNSEYMLCE
jgi:hypothetical protein